MSKLKDLKGQTFGRLTVLNRGKDYICKSSMSVVWKCQCECGNILNVRSNQLLSGRTKSCGCFRKERMTTHGLSSSTEKYIYNGMIQRCLNSNHDAYHNYGGRGIKVCDRWSDKEEGFKNFIKDMGLRPSKDYTLDRVDNDGNYAPENCRWATNEEQVVNKRTILKVNYDGKVISFRKFCLLKGLSYAYYHSIYKDSLLTIEEFIREKNL